MLSRNSILPEAANRVLLFFQFAQVIVPYLGAGFAARFFGQFRANYPQLSAISGKKGVPQKFSFCDTPFSYYLRQYAVWRNHHTAARSVKLSNA